MDASRDPDDVAAIAADLGCTVTARREQADGSIAVALDCPSVLAKLNLLVALGRYDAERFPDVIRLARSIVAGVSPECHARIEAIQRFVQAHIGFVDEPGEVYPSALCILADGVGDCDDHALLVIALAHAIGYDTTAEAFFWPSGDGHVSALCACRGAWLWTETTIPARLGEHPIDAARRLGIQTRGDIHG